MISSLHVHDAPHGHATDLQNTDQLIQLTDIVIDNLAHNLDNRIQTDTILLEFKKAFDKVPRQHLQSPLQTHLLRHLTTSTSLDTIISHEPHTPGPPGGQYYVGPYLCSSVPIYMFPGTYVPRSLCSPVPMFPGSCIPRSLCSPVQYVPRPLCSLVPMFPGPYVPWSLYSPAPMFPGPCSPRYLCSPVPMFAGPMFPGPCNPPRSLCSPVLV